MEISPRRSLSLDFDTSIKSTVASSHPPTCANCRSAMYTMQGMKTTPEPKISKSYRMTSSLSIDSAVTNPPKKENFFSSMFGALTSIVVERFTKVPGSFMSNINNTLSVTVVPNEGIISQEFFKNLTQSCDQLASEQLSNEINEDMRTPEKLSNINFYDEKSPLTHIFPENCQETKTRGKVSLNCDRGTIDERTIDARTIDERTIDARTIDERTILDNSTDVKSSERPINLAENNEEIKIASEETRKISDSINTIDKSMMKNLLVIPPNSISSEFCDSRSAEPKIHEDRDALEISEKACSTGFHTMWQKVVNGMSDRFSGQRTISPDSEVPPKKPNLSKPRRKICTAVRGRGKGRGKSQLRRNGVSQSRHRKERTKQNLYSNIQDDLEALDDFTNYDESEDDDSSVNKQRVNEQSSSLSSCTESMNVPPNRCSTLLNSLMYNSSSPRKRKQRMQNLSSKCPMRVRYVPEATMEVESYGSSYDDEYDCGSRIEFRPRLVSESSVDSEDSCCIVFESGSESESTDCDHETSSEDDQEEDENKAPKVRFNLAPQVHPMIQWDYAYRAARRGPWEQMARDRDRFRGRIQCIERILSPILSAQHRKCIWQNRFEVNE